jgi:glucose-1-phosphate adenylyltransferase
MVSDPDRANVFSIVLAGGEGKRLSPLTLDRAKPAVPFGGNYRLVDFALSNLVNASYRRIVVLTQYKSHSLDRHITTTWRMSPLLGSYVAPVPAQMRRGPYWFQGSADAIYQNLNLLRDERPDIVIVFGADHIYRMDPRQLVRRHIETGAAVTVAALRVPIEQADQFGVIETAADGHTITAFHEKPKSAKGLPDAPDQVYASMGNYVFTADTLTEVVTLDAETRDSVHDMGGSIIPMLVGSGSAHVYDFSRNEVPGATERDRGYWRDVGTLDAFYDAHMDLISVHPVFNLYNTEWPILTLPEPYPPAKFVFADDGRTGHALDSMVCSGVIISGGTVRRSVLSPNVRVEPSAEVDGSVLFAGVHVGERAIVRNAIIDKDVVVEPGAEIGLDPEADRERFTVSDRGVVVIPKGMRVEAAASA